MSRLWVVAALFLCVSAVADDESPPEINAVEACKDMSLIARDVMVARQKDRPMSETLPRAVEQLKKWVVKTFGYEDDRTEEQAAEMVMAAYDRPSFTTPNNVAREINNYENGYFEACYKGLTSD